MLTCEDSFFFYSLLHFYLIVIILVRNIQALMADKLFPAPTCPRVVTAIFNSTWSLGINKKYSCGNKLSLDPVH